MIKPLDIFLQLLGTFVYTLHNVIKKISAKFKFFTTSFINQKWLIGITKCFFFSFYDFH